MRGKIDVTWLTIATMLLASYAFFRFPQEMLRQITWKGEFVYSSKLQVIGFPMALSLLGLLGYRKLGKKKYFYLSVLSLLVLVISILVNHSIS